MANTLKLGDSKWATKDGSLLAYNDENGNFKPLPFNFTRATSGTVVNKDGLIEVVSNNVPRIDFSNDAKGALLLEPERTNLIQYSESFDNAYWSKLTSDSTPVPVVTANYAISPDGTQNADRVQLTLPTNNEFAIVRRSGINPNTPVGSTIYQSIYLKATDISQIGKKVDVYIFDTTNSSYRRIFNHVLTNNWERIESNNLINFGSTSTSVEYVFGKARANASGQSSTTGTTQSEAASDFLVWGAQLEQGSYPTSYIPTQGSQVTRVVDTCSQTPPSGIIGQTEGTVFIDLNISNTGSKFIFSLDDGGASDFIILDTSGSGQLDLQIRQSSGSITTIILGSILSNGNNKIAINYKSGDYSLYLNGTLQGTSSSALFPSGVISRIAIGGVSTYGFLSDSINDFRLYNTRLSNAELQQLTSL